MTRKHTRRTVYALVPGRTPFEVAAYNAARLTKGELVDYMLPLQVAVDALCLGGWGRLTWGAIFDAINRIECLLKIKRVDDGGFVGRMQQVCVDALDRQDTTGATSLKAAEMALVRELVVTYSDLLGEVTHAEWRAVCKKTDANIARIVCQSHDPRHGMAIEHLAGDQILKG